MEEILDDIVLLDEDGQEAHFAHILTFAYEGERYIALEPIDEDTALEDEDEAEVVLMRVLQAPEGDSYETIDNEILLNEVFDEFVSLMEEDEGEE